MNSARGAEKLVVHGASRRLPPSVLGRDTRGELRLSWLVFARHLETERGHMDRKITFKQAINEALAQEM